MGFTKILFIGDIIGRPGRIAVRELLPKLVGAHAPDIIIANGENSAGGFGLTPEIAEELKSLQVDVVTTGNHIWDKRDVYDYLDRDKRVLKPANYPEGTPGVGWGVFECASGAKVGVINLLGRVFMDSGVDCPFRVGKKLAEEIRKVTPVIFVDMHAETTSEKAAIAFYLDGFVSAVIGTHTHVQTSDEHVLAGGTAFLTDAGMTGATDSIIGMRKEAIIDKFLTRMPARFEVATKGVELQGAVITVDGATGRAVSIERLKEPV